MKTLRVLLMAMAVVAPAACKQSGDYTVKTLDNFASTSAAKSNVCMGEFTRVVYPPKIEFSSTLDGTSQAALDAHSSVVLALSSIPEPVRVLFFSHQGAIRISSPQEVRATCQSKLKSPLDVVYAGERGQVDACWSVESGGEINVYLTQDVGVIRHQLVRMIGRVMAEVLMEIPNALNAEATAENSSYVSGAQGYASMRKALANTFVSEVAAKKQAGDKRFDLSRYESLITAKNESVRSAFDMYVFAESFDSYYCTTTDSGSRATMAKTFPKTYAKFKTLAAKLEKSDEFLDKVEQRTKRGLAAKNEPRTTASFGLSDWRWYNPTTWAVTKRISDGMSKLDPFSPVNTGMSSAQAEQMYGYDSSYARTARQIEADKASGKYEIERQEQAKRVNAAIETFKAAEPAFDKTIKTAVKAGEAVDKLGIPVPGVKQVAGAAKVVDHLNNAATAANAGNADRLAQFGQLSTLGPDNPNQPPTTMGSPGMAQALDTIKNEGVAAATEAYKVAAPAAMGNEIGGAVIEGGEFGADPVGHTVEKAQETVTEAVPELTDGAMYNAQDASQDFFSDGGNQGGFESEISAESVEGIALTQPI